MAADYPDHVAALVAEHDVIEQTLEDFSGGLALAPGWASRLQAGLAVLREHILKEQDGLFPASLTCLSAADWDAVDGVRAGLLDATQSKAGSSSA